MLQRQTAVSPTSTLVTRAKIRERYDQWKMETADSAGTAESRLRTVLRSAASAVHRCLVKKRPRHRILISTPSRPGKQNWRCGFTSPHSCSTRRAWRILCLAGSSRLISQVFRGRRSPLVSLEACSQVWLKRFRRMMANKRNELQ